jgi:hypothetical protein
VSYSEYILVLNSGGSLAFSGLIEEWDKEKKILPKIDLPEEEPTMEDEVKEELKKPAQSEPEDESERIRRQVGDSNLWIYYFKAVGVRNAITILLFCIVCVVGWSFPRK